MRTPSICGEPWTYPIECIKEHSAQMLSKVIGQCYQTPLLGQTLWDFSDWVCYGTPVVECGILMVKCCGTLCSIKHCGTLLIEWEPFWSRAPWDSFDWVRTPLVKCCRTSQSPLMLKNCSSLVQGMNNALAYDNVDSKQVLG